MDIEVIELEPGERAPEAADWISIEAVEGGRYNVAGSVGGEQSLAFAGEIFQSVDEAVQAGVYWAMHRGVKILYVDRPV